MADKVTITKILAVGLETNTGGKEKTVYVKLSNPRAGLTEQQVKTAFNPFAIDTDAVIEDIEGGNISGYVTAYVENQEVIDLDIGVE